MAIGGSKRILITGAGSGVGREAALQLGHQGHHIVVADCSVAGGEATVRSIVERGGCAEFRELDLADLSNVRRFAAEEVARKQPLDVLINNAGILPPLLRATTKDDFELELGIAHLGHFALTGLLLAALERSELPRVVSVSSLAHATGRIDLDDLHMERTYSSSGSYGAAKLACLMFALELNRRAALAGSALTSVAAHPGIAKTPIAKGWEKEDRRRLWDRFELLGYHLSMRLFGQTSAQGAEPLVYAATEPSVVGGGYYGPTGFKQIAGPPGRVQPGRRALDADLARALWEASERLTGVSYHIASSRGASRSSDVAWD